jgi:hypothetical protein
MDHGAAHAPAAGFREEKRGYIPESRGFPPGSTTEGRSSRAGAYHRLTTDDMAALEPGASVTIESAADFGRPRHALGAVVRLAGSHIVVSCTSPRGVRYVPLRPP